MSLKEILESSVEVRLKAIEEIWNSLDKDTDFPLLTEAQRRELDRRIDAYEQGLDKGYTWEEVYARAKKGL
jgi:putative addiction module component (TIGR02574 family)